MSLVKPPKELSLIDGRRAQVTILCFLGVTVCVYVCTHVCMCVCVYTCVHACLHVCVCWYIYNWLDGTLITYWSHFFFQNLTILLSRMKVSNEEIKLALLQMDEDEEIPKDMMEQVNARSVICGKPCFSKSISCCCCQGWNMEDLDLLKNCVMCSNSRFLLTFCPSCSKNVVFWKVYFPFFLSLVFWQLIKFIPQSDEVELLTSHKDELEKFARADMFLYEMSCIPHYGQRLETLFFKKKLTERVGEVQPKLQGKIANLQNKTLLLRVLCFLTLGVEVSGHQVRSRFMLCVIAIALYFLCGKLSSGVKFNGVVIFFFFQLSSTPANNWCPAQNWRKCWSSCWCLAITWTKELAAMLTVNSIYIMIIQNGAVKLVLWCQWMHLNASSDVREPISLHQAVHLWHKLNRVTNKSLFKKSDPWPSFPAKKKKEFAFRRWALLEYKKT